MAGTVIDALVVSLGLDSSLFTKGQKDAAASLKKTSDQADKTAKDMEANGKKAAEFFGQIKVQVLELFAVFTAGKGISSFVSDVVAGDAAVGRLATNVGMSTDSLSAWQGVAERAGGSAAGISGSIQNLSSQMQKMALTGQSDVIPFLAQAHINLQKFFDASAPMSDKLLDLSDAFSKMSAPRAQAIGAGMGLDQGTINVLMQGRAAVEAMLAEQAKIGETNAADAKSAQQLQAAWNALGQSSTDLGRKILTSLSPFIQQLSAALLKLSEWAASHRPMVEAMFIGLAAAVTAFAAVLAAPLAGIAALSTGIGVAVAAIAVLYDDWKTWIDGGQSAFGGFWQFFANAWNTISSIVGPAFEYLGKLFGDYFNDARDILKLIVGLFFGSADDVRKAWASLGADIQKQTQDWVKFFDNAVKAILGLNDLIAKAIVAAFKGAFDYVEGRAKVIWDLITGKHDTPAPSSGSGASSAGGQSAAASVLSGTSSGGGSVMAQAAQAAKDAQSKYGIPAAVTLAQFAIESGNGARMPAGSNNPFGIKATAGQSYVEAETNEFINGRMQRVTQRFAKFDSLADAFDAHAKLLATASPYAAARTHESDPKAFANALTGVYATDPQYGAKLNAIMARNGSGGGNTSTSDVQIAQINVQTQATDAKGIAKDIGPAVQKYAFTMQANSGLG